MEYTVLATFSSGTGAFGDLIIAISEIIYWNNLLRLDMIKDTK